MRMQLNRWQAHSKSYRHDMTQECFTRNIGVTLIDIGYILTCTACISAHNLIIKARKVAHDNARSSATMINHQPGSWELSFVSNVLNECERHGLLYTAAVLRLCPLTRSEHRTCHLFRIIHPEMMRVRSLLFRERSARQRIAANTNFST